MLNIWSTVSEKQCWSGDFDSWGEAINHSTGYDSSLILEKCKAALLKVKNGEAVYERDSVIFDEIQYSWPVLSALLRVALENKGSLSVLDFGGSLGSSYFQNKAFLDGCALLKWSVVEQAHFVKCGKENFQTNELKFYETMEDCLISENVNVLLLSSVLQYLEKPYDWICQFTKLGIKNIILDRTAFVNDKEILTVQKVPKEIYDASYPSWFLDYKNVLNEFLVEGYQLVTKFDNGFTSPVELQNDQMGFWNGVILRKK
ncbi:MAG: TIGR04325 family methyltransferase [Cyclobacteriaceae bacterium]